MEDLNMDEADESTSRRSSLQWWKPKESPVKYQDEIISIMRIITGTLALPSAGYAFVIAGLGGSSGRGDFRDQIFNTQYSFVIATFTSAFVILFLPALCDLLSALVTSVVWACMTVFSFISLARVISVKDQAKLMLATSSGLDTTLYLTIPFIIICAFVVLHAAYHWIRLFKESN